VLGVRERGNGAAVSFDDLIEVHERLSLLVTRLGADEDWHLARLFWPAVFLPAPLGHVLAALGPRPHAARTVPMRPPPRGVFVVAIGLDITSPAVFWASFDHGDLVYELEVVAEEGTELAGWALIATVLIASALAIVEPVSDR
jgi:hypothetical protein